jgi:Tfp pilus assembly protein PilN
VNAHYENARLQKLLSDVEAEYSYAASDFDEIQKRVITDQSAFFDRLSLFNTGSIAATLTFAGVLHQHQPMLSWTLVLYSGWILLVISTAACYFRNWKINSHLFYQSAASYHEACAKRAFAQKEFYAKSPSAIVDTNTGQYVKRQEQVTKLAEARQRLIQRAEEYQGLSDRDIRIRTYLEKIIFSTSLAGICCLIIFAIRNFH